MRFKQFYLIEGGNVRVPDPDSDKGYIEAEKLDLTKLTDKDFEYIKIALINCFKEFNKAFKDEYGEPFWKNEDKLIKSAIVFSGSTRPLFSKHFKDYTEFKKSVGDLDLQIPEELMTKMKTFLEKNKNKTFGEFKFKGFTAAGTQLNGLLEFPENWKQIINHIQIDFEGTPFKNGLPTEFATLGHYSSWQDISHGVKGLFAKYLLRALVSSIKTEKVTIVGKTGKPLSREPIQSFLGFSVDKGVRVKIKPVLDDKGEIKITNGLPTYIETPTSDSTYEQDLSKIYSLVFGEMPSEKEKTSLYSFIRLLDEMKKKLSPDKIEEVFNRFAELLWAPGAQGIERNDPEGDKEIKSAAYKAFVDKFPELKKIKVQDMIDKYTKTYRMT